MSRLLLATVVMMCLADQGMADELTREEKVRADKQRVTSEGFWLYNDLEGAYATARETGKPLLVALRCIPCEECVKLDDELVDTDPVIRPLLEQFVCVRIVGTNGLDLNTFQYDTDQSFAMFMLNADKTIYGRFGTRSHSTEWVGDVSLEGMAEALRGALDLHRQYPSNRESLAGKRGEPLEFATPEKYPSLRDKYTDQLNYSGDVVKSCIHCHQIGDARREYYWSQSQSIPERLLFPYPHPKSVGLVLDPKERATLKSVTADSPAAAAGFQTGDQLLAMDGQPLLSMADVQWVLDRVPAAGGQVSVTVRRGERELETALELQDGWRRKDDTSWRVASWQMRRIATGGMWLQPLDEAQRQSLGIDPAAMALRVRHLGNFGAHAAAKHAGFQKDDVLVEFDQRRDLQAESDVFAHVNDKHRPGQTVDVVVLREGREKNLSLPIQE